MTILFKKARLRVLIYMSITAMVLCAFDAWATIRGIEAGTFSELNPLMAWIIERSVAGFYAFKLSVTGICVGLLLYKREHSLAIIGLCVAVLSYLVITGLHIYMMLAS